MDGYFKRYDSIGEMIADARQGRDKHGADRWAGGKTLQHACDVVMSGAAHDDAVMREARELYDKVDASFRDRETHAWMPSVAGAYPIVAELLQGVPDYMRAQQPVESDTAPIKIYIEASISAGVSQHEITRRGVALTALAMRMSEERAVEVHMFSGWKLYTKASRYCIWDTKLDVTPISLTQIINTIAHTSFMRMINFATCRFMAGSISDRESFGWAFERHKVSRKEGLRERLGLEPQDIIVERGYLDDAQLMARDPVEWVHAQLEKQRTLDVA
jgi:hypothetical protein